MSLAEHTSLVQTLLDQPSDERALFAAYEALKNDPKEYVALLVTAARMTEEGPVASHFLTEAARVELHVARDAHACVKLLTAALDKDPFNLRALDHLIELHRAHPLDEQLTFVLRGSASQLSDRLRRESVALPKASVAFEKIGGLFESIGDSAAALSALRTALELERARGRHTTPSPPPAVAPESSFRSLTGDPASRRTPAPGLPWTVNPDSDARDTLPVAAGDKSSPRTTPPESSSHSAPPVPPSARPAADPLLSIIERLHALRRADNLVDGAALVLRTALDAIPAVAAIVHVADGSAQDFVVVAASGEHNVELIGTRAKESDPVFERAFRDLTAVTRSAIDAASDGWFDGARFRLFAPEHSLLCAAVHYDGRCLGAIELFDPRRTSGFSEADRHAMTYVGERFGEFLADRSFAF